MKQIVNLHSVFSCDVIRNIHTNKAGTNVPALFLGFLNRCAVLLFKYQCTNN